MSQPRTPNSKNDSSSITLHTVAHMVGASLRFPECSPFDADTQVTGISTLQDAHSGQISFLANSKYQSQLAHTNALAVLVTERMAASCPVVSLVVDDPYVAFAMLSKQFEYHSLSANTNTNISPLAVIHETAKLGDGVKVGNYVHIGQGVTIGAGTHINPNVVIEDNAVIGEHCHLSSGVIIHHHCHLGDFVRIAANATIGADGFGFAPVKPKKPNDSFYWERIAQLGAVRIGPHCSIGANTCIDRGALNDTIIGDGVIIDNLVQIAHNVHIGDYTAIAACTGIAGSTKVGKHCIIGGGVGIAGHVEITDGVTITGGSNIFGSILSPGEYSSGVRHMPTPQWRRAAVNFKQLAEYAPKKLIMEINDLKKTINTLKSRLGE